jgi:hypothetical protein
MKGMKTSMGLALLFVAAGLMKPLPVSGQGTIVPNNIVFGQPAAPPPGTYIMQSQYPGDAGGLFALSLTTVGVGQYQINSYGIAEAYSVHTATQGLAFTPAYVSGAVPLLDNGGSNPGQYQFSLAVGQSLLLAYWDNAGYQFNSPQPGAPGNPAPDNYDAYGWFRLTRHPLNGIVIADSATAMGGGIIVGTYTAVPEPTSFVLGLLAAFGIALRRQR